MNAIEALQALMDGKKIRKRNWDSSEYLVRHTNNKIVNEINRCTYLVIEDLAKDVWELFIPKLELKVGCSYRTRDGNIVLLGAYNPNARNGDQWIGWIGCKARGWSDLGSYLEDCGVPHPNDLIERIDP